MRDVFSKAQLAFGLVVGVAIFLELLGVVTFPWPLRLAEVFLLTIWLFDGAMHAYSRWLRDDLHWFLVWMWAPGLFVVGLLDVVFNVIVGVPAFREAPQWGDGEFLFSQRVQRHVDDPGSSQRRMGHFWAGVLNNIAPGHIKV